MQQSILIAHFFKATDRRRYKFPEYHFNKSSFYLSLMIKIKLKLYVLK